jgi:hypothetical protein
LTLIDFLEAVERFFTGCSFFIPPLDSVATAFLESGFGECAVVIADRTLTNISFFARRLPRSLCGVRRGVIGKA